MLGTFTAGQLALLAALVFLAGVVDALAGGGGLITLPAYLAAGLDPALLLGTNKLSSSIGTVASSVMYQRRLRFSLKSLAPALAAALAGSYGGARLAARLDPAWMRPLMLAVIPVVAYLVYSKHRFGHEDHSASLGPSERLVLPAAVSLPIGTYDGFFGPGTGTFFALALSRVCRYDLLGATGRAKLLNLASNCSALLAFLAAGRVNIPLGVAMGAVSVAGHWVGSHLGLRQGAGLIRPVAVAVLLALFARLLLH